MEPDRRTHGTDDPVVVALVIAKDDHESRIRAGEKFQYLVTGALAFCAVAFPATVGVVAAVLR